MLYLCRQCAMQTLGGSHLLVGIGSRRQEMDLAIAEPLDNFLVCVHASTKLPCIVDIDLVQFAPILRIHNLNDALHNDKKASF